VSSIADFYLTNPVARAEGFAMTAEAAE